MSAVIFFERHSPGGRKDGMQDGMQESVPSPPPSSAAWIQPLWTTPPKAHDQQLVLKSENMTGRQAMGVSWEILELEKSSRGYGSHLS